MPPVSDRSEGGRPGEPGGAGFSARERGVWLGIALVLLASLVIGIVVLAGNGEDGGAEFADGVLVDATGDRLRIDLVQPIDGRDQLDLVVRPADRAELDIPHLQEHVRARLPTRVHYEREGGEYVARRADDLPALP
jgi:hypothetical protein